MKSRNATRMTGTAAPIFCLSSVHGRVCLSDYTGRRHVALYFMPSFTSSLAWRGIVALGGLYDSLQARDAEVLVIGRGGYLRQATRLAADLELPFLFLSDKDGKVSSLYGLDGIGRGPPPTASFLVDKQNIIRYVGLGTPSGGRLDVTGLMNAVERLSFYLPPAPRVGLCRSV
jgi:peroxiredoxin